MPWLPWQRRHFEFVQPPKSCHTQFALEWHVLCIASIVRCRRKSLKMPNGLWSDGVMINKNSIKSKLT
jgi:hypothetical protein